MIDIKTLKKETNDLTVLYVEDDLAIRNSVSTYLKKLFKKVTTAKDALQALELYKKEFFDLIITDINMPEMDGLTMSSKIKELNHEQNILIISAYSDSTKFINSIKIGVDGYIIKPINYDNLNTTLFKICMKINKFKENELYSSSLKSLVEEKTNENLKLEFEKVNNYEKTLFALIDMIETRDPYTGKHSLRVAKYSKLIAKQLGYLEKECNEIYRAAILHDLGKISIPDSLLLKPNKLNSSEYNLIKEHVQLGYDVLNKIPIFKEISEMIYCHHERIDGSGYPNGLKDKDIPIKANIIALADTFDAMTTSRIYQKSRTIETALETIKSLSGIHYKEEIVNAAIIVLKDIKINLDISQLPKNKFEEERFSYFYKDNLTQVYNDKYLDLILKKNSFDYKLASAILISINNFRNYNKRYGWSQGNDLLITISKLLSEKFNEHLIFRVFGDSFILTLESYEFNKDSLNILDNILNSPETQLTYNVLQVDLLKNKVESTLQIERLFIS